MPEIGEAEIAKIRETIAKIAPEYQRLKETLRAGMMDCECSGGGATSGGSGTNCKCPTAALA